jgi:ribosomal subunit interface protein
MEGRKGKLEALKGGTMTLKPDFTWEFNNEVTSMSPEMEQSLRDEAEQRLNDLRRGHTDLVGAAVSLEQLAPQRTPDFYQARVVVYIRPENIAGVAKEDNPVTALKSALNSVERQVRENRDRLRERYQQP